MVPRETNGTLEEYLRVFGEVGKKSPWYLNTNTHNHWELFPFNMYIVLRKTHCNIPRSTTPNPPPPTTSSQETSCSHSNNWSKRRKLRPGCNIHIQFFFLTRGCQLVTNKCVNEWHMELLLLSSVRPSIHPSFESTSQQLVGCLVARVADTHIKWSSNFYVVGFDIVMVYFVVATHGVRVCVCVVAHAVVPVVAHWWCCLWIEAALTGICLIATVVVAVIAIRAVAAAHAVI